MLLPCQCQDIYPEDWFWMRWGKERQLGHHGELNLETGSNVKRYLYDGDIRRIGNKHICLDDFEANALPYVSDVTPILTID